MAYPNFPEYSVPKTPEISESDLFTLMIRNPYAHATAGEIEGNNLEGARLFLNAQDHVQLQLADERIIDYPASLSRQSAFSLSEIHDYLQQLPQRELFLNNPDTTTQTELLINQMLARLAAEQIQPALNAQQLSRIALDSAHNAHEQWRQHRKQQGAAPKLWRTMDSVWLSSHKHLESGMIDISQLSFDSLPNDWQIENIEDSVVALELILNSRGKADFKSMSTNVIAKELHKHWLKRPAAVGNPNAIDLDDSELSDMAKADFLKANHEYRIAGLTYLLDSLSRFQQDFPLLNPGEGISDMQVEEIRPNNIPTPVNHLDISGIKGHIFNTEQQSKVEGLIEDEALADKSAKDLLDAMGINTNALIRQINPANIQDYPIRQSLRGTQLVPSNPQRHYVNLDGIIIYLDPHPNIATAAPEKQAKIAAKSPDQIPLSNLNPDILTEIMQGTRPLELEVLYDDQGNIADLTISKGFYYTYGDNLAADAVVLGMITDTYGENKLALLTIGPLLYPGKLSVPGGMNEGELGNSAAGRELQEETGVDLGNTPNIEGKTTRVREGRATLVAGPVTTPYTFILPDSLATRLEVKGADDATTAGFRPINVELLAKFHSPTHVQIVLDSIREWETQTGLRLAKDGTVCRSKPLVNKEWAIQNLARTVMQVEIDSETNLSALVSQTIDKLRATGLTGSSDTVILLDQQSLANQQQIESEIATLIDSGKSVIILDPGTAPEFEFVGDLARRHPDQIFAIGIYAIEAEPDLEHTVSIEVRMPAADATVPVASLLAGIASNLRNP